MHERLGIGNRDLPAVKKHSGRCYVVGSGRCVWDDLQAAGWHIDTRDKVLTVNDVTMHMPGPVHMAYSNDHHWLPRWVEARRPQYQKQWGRPGQHTCGNGMSPMQTIWPWPGHGSSGLNAVYTALAIGFDEIVVCGIPLDDSGHYFDPPWVKTNFTNECRDHSRGGPKWWREAARTVFDHKVRVMSGRMADWMASGMPVT